MNINITGTSDLLVTKNCEVVKVKYIGDYFIVTDDGIQRNSHGIALGRHPDLDIAFHMTIKNFPSMSAQFI